MTFGVWLKKQPDGNADIKEAKAFAAAQGASWPYESEQLGDYLALASAVQDAADRQRAMRAVGNAFQRWTGEAVPPQAQAATGLLTNRFGVIALLLFGLVFIVLLGYGVYSTEFLTAISKPEQARGLITFLFAFSTIAIFLLVAIATFWLQDREEVEARFGHAKDLITIMIGVLGTVLGFYFGSIGSEEARRGMYVANVASPPEAARPGNEVELSGVIIGGTAPYHVDIAFSDPTGNVPTDGLTIRKEGVTSGAIREKVKIPDTAKAPAAVTFTITATDATNTIARSVGTLFVLPPAAPAAPVTPAPGAAGTTAPAAPGAAAPAGSGSTAPAAPRTPAPAASGTPAP